MNEPKIVHIAEESLPKESDKLNSSADIVSVSVTTHLQKIITTIAGTASIVTLSGYIVLHSYLRAYTDIPIVGIPPQFYIVAGINLAVFVAILLLFMWFAAQVSNFGGWFTTKQVDKISNLRRKRFLAIALLCVLLALALKTIYDYPSILEVSAVFFIPFLTLLSIYTVEVCKGREANAYVQQFLQFIAQPSLIFNHLGHSLITLSSIFLCLGFYVFFLGGTYGSIGYATLPSALGGGKPASVHLIFRQNSDLASLNIGINSDMQSEGLCLLSTTGSQYVLYHPQDKRIVIIPFDLVLTIFDSDLQFDCIP